MVCHYVFMRHLLSPRAHLSRHQERQDSAQRPLPHQPAAAPTFFVGRRRVRISLRVRLLAESLDMTAPPSCASWRAWLHRANSNNADKPILGRDGDVIQPVA